MTITEKTAYLKGLAEGMELDVSTKEGKLMKAIIDTIDAIASQVADMDDELKAVDEDLASLEDDVYEEDDCDCDCCDGDCDEDDGDEQFYEVECPNCKNTVYLDEDLLLEGVIECPECGDKIELEIEDECQCGCCGTDEK